MLPKHFLKVTTLAFAVASLFPGKVHADDNLWLGTTNQSWSNSANNWSLFPGSWDNVFVDTAIFSGNAPGTITVDSPITLRAIGFTANGYTISGPQQLSFFGGFDGSYSTGELRVNTGISATINADMAGPAPLTKTGPGKLTLTGTLTGDHRTLVGGTTISAGTLQFGRTVSLYNNNPASWTATTLVVESGATAAFNVGGTGEFTSGNIDTLKALGTATGGFKNGSILGLDTANAPGGNFTYASAITNTNGGFNRVGLTKLGTGTLTLTGYCTHRLTTTISAGTLQIGNGGTTGEIISDVSNNANLTFNRSDSPTYHGHISGSGTLTKLGAGTLTLLGSNTHTGTTTISAGTLQIGSDGFGAGFFTGSIAGDITNNANLIFSHTDTVTHAGNISGNGTLTKLGNGLLVLTGNKTGTGVTTIAAGTLQIGAGGTTGSININGPITNNAALVFNRSDSIEYYGVISGTGSLTKSCSGTLTLGGNNTHTGGITVSQGELLLTHPNAASGFAASAVRLGDAAAGNSDIKLTYATPNTTDLVVRGGVAVRRMNAVNAVNTGGSGNRTLGLQGSPGYYFDIALNRALVLTSESSGSYFMGQITGPGAGAGNDSIILDTNNSGFFTLTPKDTGTQSLANTYSGNLRVKSGNYEIQQHSYIADIPANSNLNIPDTASVTVDAGATLRFVWGDETFDALNGSGTLTRNTGDGQGIRTLTLGASGGTGHFSGTIDSEFYLTKAGNGTQTLSGDNTYIGGTTIAAGTLQIGNGGTTGTVTGPITNNAALVFNRLTGSTFPDVGSITGTGSVTVQGGNASAARIQIGGLSITAGQSLTLTTPDTVSSVSSLTLPALATLDLATQDLIVASGSLSTLRASIAEGLTSATGLRSSVAGTGPSTAPDFHATLGLVSNTDEFGLPRFTTFSGLAVTPSSLLVKYTYIGDTNLDGILDATDFNAVLNGFTNNLTGWQNGDINYDGTINATDWSAFLTAYNFYLTSGVPFDTTGGPAGSIPEPASLALALPALALVSRRRRYAPIRRCRPHDTSPIAK
jgi:autotransporter-associated beta strand protein